jgi:crotonobetainyl-CoA:carnitine CoA-transferase CaiB-like acyl-CoA transferase
MKLSRTPVRADHPPPLLGQHTEAVLAEVLGLSASALAELRTRGVV